MNWRRLGDFALIMLVFVLVGPLVGLGVTALGIGGGVTLGNGDLRGGAAVAAFLLVYGVLFAHFIGAVPAAVSALLVSAWSYKRGRVPLVVGALAGLVSCTLLIGSKLGLLPELTGSAASDLLLAAVVVGAHILAAIACTWLTRRWQ